MAVNIALIALRVTEKNTPELAKAPRRPQLSCGNSPDKPLRKFMGYCLTVHVTGTRRVSPIEI